jgi:hypothetical protein
MKKISFLVIFLVTINQSFSQIVGCTLTGTKTELGTLYSSMNNPEIDRIVTEELRFLSASFLVKPAFYFYDDSQGKNAFSTPQVLLASSTDGTICFGVKLHEQQMTLSMGGTNIPIILAHEFAHTVARKYQLNLPTKQNELFADYLAGCYMFYRNRSFKSTDINAAFQAFYNLGDNDFSNPDHHGTPVSRSKCIKQGYNDCLNAMQQGRVYNLNDVVSMGKQFVTTNSLD